MCRHAHYFYLQVYDPPTVKKVYDASQDAVYVTHDALHVVHKFLRVFYETLHVAHDFLGLSEMVLVELIFAEYGLKESLLSGYFDSKA